MFELRLRVASFDEAASAARATARASKLDPAPRPSATSVPHIDEGPRPSAASVPHVDEGPRSSATSVPHVDEGPRPSPTSFPHVDEGPRPSAASVPHVAEGPKWHPCAQDEWLEPGDLPQHTIPYLSCRELARRLGSVSDGIESIEPKELHEEVIALGTRTATLRRRPPPTSSTASQPKKPRSKSK